MGALVLQWHAEGFPVKGSKPCSRRWDIVASLDREGMEGGPFEVPLACPRLARTGTQGSREA